MNDDILYEKLGHVRLITINRPAKMNSLNFAAHEALVDFWQEFNSDNEELKAVTFSTIG